MKNHPKLIIFGVVVALLVAGTFFLPFVEKPPKLAPIEKKIEVLRVTDTRTMSGRVIGYDKLDDGIDLKVCSRDDKHYHLHLTATTFVVVQDIDKQQRIEHNGVTIAGWIDVNPCATVMIGVHKGNVTDVILHPFEKKNPDD